MNATSRETPAANANARPFIATNSSRGTSAGDRATINGVAATARDRPAAPPASASSDVSASASPAKCFRVAPSACRTAMSGCRLVARTSSNPATFAQAINRTSSTAPRRPSIAARVEPKMVSDNGVNVERKLSGLKYGRCICCQMPVNSLRAVSRPELPCNRPRPIIQNTLRFSRSGPPPAEATGTQYIAPFG